MIDRSIIRDAKKAVRELENVIYPTLKEVFNRYNDVLIEYNTQQQLYKKSEDSNTNPLRPPYAASTRRRKRQKGQISTRVTLKDTGDFYDSFNIFAEDDRLVFEVSVNYASYLTDKYGEEIIGLQDANLEEFYNKYIEKELESNLFDIIDKNKI